MGSDDGHIPQDSDATSSMPQGQLTAGSAKLNLLQRRLTTEATLQLQKQQPGRWVTPYQSCFIRLGEQARMLAPAKVTHALSLRHLVKVHGVELPRVVIPEAEQVLSRCVDVHIRE